MSKKVLRLVSAVLALILALTSFPLAIAAENNTVSHSPLKVEIETNKDSYSAMGTAKFEITITNTSSATIENISAEALFDQLTPIGRKSETTVETASLAAGESIGFAFKAVLNEENTDVNFFESFIIKIKKFFSGKVSVGDNGFDDERSYYDETKALSFSDNSVFQIIRVWYDSGITLTIDQNDFETTENDISISGKVSSKFALDNVSYNVKNQNNESISSGNAIIDNTKWEASIRLRPGFNIIEIIASSLSSAQNKKTITIYYDRGTHYTPNEENIVFLNDSKSSGYINNIVLVFFKEGTSEQEKQQVVESVNGTVVGKINALNQYQIEIVSSNLDELKNLCAQLERNNCVSNAQYDTVIPDDYMEIIDSEDPGQTPQTPSSPQAVTPDDPWKDTFQGFWGTDWDESKPDGYNWWLEAIQAPSAWEYNSRFKKITVGVVDAGVDADHEDLKTTVLNKEDNVPDDHGTHVSGIIGATANNQKGITGIVWNKKIVTVDCYKGKDTTSTSTLMDAAIDCIENGAKVVNWSNGTSDLTDEEVYERGLYAAEWIIEIAEDLTEDFIIVQSAGNDGADAKTNGSFCCISRSIASEAIQSSYSSMSVDELMSHFIIVASVDKSSSNYKLSSFSNYGSKINIAAPGSKIFSTVVSGGANGSYGNMSGTSMAAPIVTAVSSLVWSINSNFTSEDVKDIVCNNTKDSVKARKSSDSKTYKMVNAKLAVEEAIRRTDASGTMSGRFVDAENGTLISNVTITCVSYDGHGNPDIINNGMLVNNGYFSKELPSGTYRFKLSADNYIDKYINVTITAEQTISLGDIAMSTNIGEGNIRIVLRWGATPSDLDSHFIGTNTDDYKEHVYYSSMGSRSSAWLDIDDITSYGPETITINLSKFDAFTYCVHNFSDKYATSSDSTALSLAQSEATVEVYSDDSLIAFYSIPNNRKGTVWKVFSMDSNGVITDINRFEYQSNPEQVGMSSITTCSTTYNIIKDYTSDKSFTQ